MRINLAVILAWLFVIPPAQTYANRPEDGATIEPGISIQNNVSHTGRTLFLAYNKLNGTPTAFRLISLTRASGPPLASSRPWDEEFHPRYQLNTTRWENGLWRSRRILLIKDLSPGYARQVSTKTFWLDAAHHEHPPLLLTLLHRGEDGPVGDDVTLAFPQGWNGPVRVQCWPSYANFMGATSNQLRRSKSGRLFLETTETGGIFENEYGEPSDHLRLQYWWVDREGKFLADPKN